MTYGQFNVLETDGTLSIIKQVPRRNMCWEIYIPDAGEDAYKICQLLNKEWEDRQPKTSSGETKERDEALHANPDSDLIQGRVVQGLAGFNPFLSREQPTLIEPQGPAEIKEALGFDK